MAFVPQGPSGHKLAYDSQFAAPDQQWVDSNWTLYRTPDGGRLRARGVCERCGHASTSEIHDQIVEGGTSQSIGEPIRERIHLFDCACIFPHPGRPEGVSLGCGRHWLGWIRLLPSGTYSIAAETRDALMLPAKEWGRAKDLEQKSIQQAAEKWTGGIAAMFALSSLAGLLSGPDTINQLSPVWRILAAATAAVFLVTSVIAFLLAYRGAFGWPKIASVTTHEEFLDWYTRRQSTAATAARSLQRGVALLCVALVASFSILIIVWFAPRAKPINSCSVQGVGNCTIR